MNQVPDWLKIFVPAMLLAGLFRVILKSVVALPW